MKRPPRLKWYKATGVDDAYTACLGACSLYVSRHYADDGPDSTYQAGASRLLPFWARIWRRRRHDTWWRAGYKNLKSAKRATRRVALKWEGHEI